MDTNKLRELVKAARVAAQTDEFHELINHFEQFIDLFEQKDTANGDPAFIQQMTLAQNQFWGSFEKVSLSFGLTPEMLKQYFETHDHSSPRQMQQMEIIQREILPETSPTASPKKLRKNSRKMRA